MSESTIARANWIVQRGDQQYAAHDKAMLAQWASSGNLIPTDLIWDSETGRWWRANEFLSFGGALQPNSHETAVLGAQRQASDSVQSMIALQASPLIVIPTKSVGLAIFLGAAFGPLGLLYSTIIGAVVMFLVNIFVGLVTFGFGLFLTWPICAVWAAVAAQAYNRRLLAGHR